MAKRKKVKPRRDSRAREAEVQDDEPLGESEDDAAELEPALALASGEEEAEEPEAPDEAEDGDDLDEPVSAPARGSARAHASSASAEETERAPVGRGAEPTRVSKNGGLIAMGVVFGLIAFAILVQVLMSG